MKNKKRKWIWITLALVILIPLCIWLLMPLIRMLATEEGRAELCARVKDFGVLAPLVFTLLMVLQVVVAVIPGGPLELVGGMLFGGWQGILYTTIGTLVGTLLVYCLVKKLGRPFVEKIVSEKNLHRFSFLEDEEKLSFWVFILFLIPGIPKDLLTYIVPLTKMSGKRFVLLSTLGRFPSLAASVLVGDSISDGRYRLTIVLCVAAVLLVFIGYQVRGLIMKGRDDSK